MARFKVSRIRNGSHLGRQVGWHLTGYKYNRHHPSSGHGFALRFLKTKHFNRVHLDPTTEYHNGIVIHR